MIREKSLSERMLKIAACVLPGETAADIGTDHGLVPIWLLKHGIGPRVILTDVRPGPLEKARLNLIKAGIEPERYELRLGSGLSVLGGGEASTVILAGMGGELICELLDADREKAASFRRLILQPRSRSFSLRRYLNENDYYVNFEMLAKEGRRISEILVAERIPGDHPERFERELDYILPPLLALEEESLYRRFLDQRIAQAALVAGELKKAEGDVFERLIYWEDRLRELKHIRSVL